MVPEPGSHALQRPPSGATARAWVIAGAAVYLLLVNLIYVLHISPEFAYLGYRVEPPAWGPLLLAYLVAWMPSVWMPVRVSRPSQIVYWILYLLAFVPSAFMPFLTLDRPAASVVTLLLALLLAHAALGIIYVVPRAVLPRPRLHPWAYWSALIVIGAVLLASVVATFGITLDVPGLLEVYDVRADFREATTGRLVRYAISWLGNILLPLMIAVGILRRNPLLVVAGAAGEVFLYATTGFKSILFAVALLVGLLIALRARGRYFGLIAAWGASTAVASTWLLDLITQTHVLSSLFVRRLIITPGILTGWYYDFFSDNPKTLLAYGVLEGIVAYPYDRIPPLIIGAEYFGREGTYANANFWADGFANFGFAGLFGFTILLAAVLWLFDTLVAQRGFGQLGLTALLLGVPAVTLANSALLTSLLTHGIGLAWLVLYLLPPSTMVRAERTDGARHVRLGVGGRS